MNARRSGCRPRVALVMVVILMGMMGLLLTVLSRQLTETATLVRLAGANTAARQLTADGSAWCTVHLDLTDRSEMQLASDHCATSEASLLISKADSADGSRQIVARVKQGRLRAHCLVRK